MHSNTIRPELISCLPKKKEKTKLDSVFCYTSNGVTKITYIIRLLVIQASAQNNDLSGCYPGARQ